MKMQIVLLSLALLSAALVQGCGNDDGGISTDTAVEGQETDATLAGLSRFFPSHDQIEGLTGANKYSQFDGKTLFEYMNGGAEIYLALGFRTIGTREYTTTLADDIFLTIELYDMTLPQNAQKIFQKNNASDAESADVGEGSSLGGGTIEFWTGHYLVRIRCDDVGAEVDRLLKETALFVEKGLKRAE